MVAFETGDLVRKKHLAYTKSTLSIVMDYNDGLRWMNRLRVCFVIDGKTEMVLADDYEIVSKNIQR